MVDQISVFVQLPTIIFTILIFLVVWWCFTTLLFVFRWYLFIFLLNYLVLLGNTQIGILLLLLWLLLNYLTWRFIFIINQIIARWMRWMWLTRLSLCLQNVLIVLSRTWWVCLQNCGVCVWWWYYSCALMSKYDIIEQTQENFADLPKAKWKFTVWALFNKYASWF